MVRLAEEHGTDLAQYRPLLFRGKELSFMSGTASASVASQSNSVVRTFLSLRTSTKQSQTPRRVELAAPAGEKNGAALHLERVKDSLKKGRHPFGVCLVCSLEAVREGFGTWLVMRRFLDKPKVLTSHSGVSYSFLPVPLVKHFPPRAGAGALGKGIVRAPWEREFMALDSAHLKALGFKRNYGP
eukprot:CAMPEP_0194551854 /NCGR_PEP_ID=MMETSP0253-20130528/96433_1 /TAXON_ID=2966 /ORGANISM="Noctiluca scintillans" /LENGTH=184 /DNA_ID=CAMNT_0039399315 /DNA_START=205 /DNA_END=755 /DNA_ORIENTATION=+